MGLMFISLLLHSKSWTPISHPCNMQRLYSWTGSGSLLYLGFGETQRSSSENAAWVEEKAWFLASEVQGQTPPPPSQVTSEWLLRLNASSVKWGNMFLARKVIRRGQWGLTCESAEQGGRGKPGSLSLPCSESRLCHSLL